jgi:hypothetical protein
MNQRFFAALLAALPLAAAAQGSGELWEITMNIPGMPAGMMPPQRVCQGDDPERAAQQQGREKQDCKVTDRKQSGTRTTISLSCKDGSTMVIDQQFNAARTEFKSTMTMKSKRDGEQTMTQTGRKVGACDAVATRKEQEAQVAAFQKQAAAAQAQGAAAMKKAADTQIRQCAEAAEKMSWHGLGIWGQCYAKKSDAQCKSMQSAYQSQPEVAKSCNASVAEFCKRYRTPEGFLRANADENAAQVCGVTTAAVKAEQCPRVAQSQSPLAFLGAYCPVEAKPLAQEHCAGRDYTSKMGGKYAAFCQNYLAHASLEKPAAEPQSATQKATDQVKQGVSKGMDKLRGLFGR